MEAKEPVVMGPVSESSKAAPSPEALAESAAGMTMAELRIHVERCQRLMARPQLLERLPDRGVGIRNRHDAFAAELSRREEDGGSAPTVEDGASRSVKQTVVRDEVPSSGDAAVGNAGDSSSAAVTAIMEKHGDRRVSVEENVRRMYGGSLSEREISRILEDVPPGFFLTYNETREREKMMAKEARKEELAKLRLQAKGRVL